jgi:hypothetical protein
MQGVKGGFGTVHQSVAVGTQQVAGLLIVDPNSPKDAARITEQLVGREDDACVNRLSNKPGHAKVCGSLHPGLDQQFAVAME